MVRCVQLFPIFLYPSTAPTPPNSLPHSTRQKGSGFCSTTVFPVVLRSPQRHWRLRKMIAAPARKAVASVVVVGCFFYCYYFLRSIPKIRDPTRRAKPVLRSIAWGTRHLRVEASFFIFLLRSPTQTTLPTALACTGFCSWTACREQIGQNESVSHSPRCSSSALGQSLIDSCNTIYPLRTQLRGRGCSSPDERCVTVTYPLPVWTSPWQ